MENKNNQDEPMVEVLKSPETLREEDKVDIGAGIKVDGMKQSDNNVNQLDMAVEDAKKSDGYLIMISKLRKDKITHTYFTKTFRRGDIMTCLDEHAKLLELEV